MAVKHKLGLLVTFMALGGCYWVEPPETTLPFVGVWDCEGTRVELSKESYRYGRDEVPLRQINSDQRDGTYTLVLPDERQISLADVDTTELVLMGSGGKPTRCQRVLGVAGQGG